MQTIVLNFRLPGLNEIVGCNRSNRFIGAKQKKETEELIKTSLINQDIKPIQKGSSFIFYWTISRRDPDNVSAGQKFIFDSLQEVGLLPNDNIDYVQEIHHCFKKGKEERVSIHILENSDMNHDLF